MKDIYLIKKEFSFQFETVIDSVDIVRYVNDYFFLSYPLQFSRGMRIFHRKSADFSYINNDEEISDVQDFLNSKEDEIIKILFQEHCYLERNNFKENLLRDLFSKEFLLI